MTMRTATFLASAAAVVVTATVGGLATRPASQSVWYGQLRKPAYQPPRSAFPVVWPVLYADIAAVSALTASSADLARCAIAVRGRRAAWLCLYPAWCAFAFALSAHIWMLNRRGKIDAP